MPKPNREILTGGKRYKDAKKSKNRVNEVIFDKDQRKNYLTGFHKRKLERKKKAQDYIAEQVKKDRIEERARIREERKLHVQKRLAEMKEAMELNPFFNKADLEQGDDDDSEEANSHSENEDDTSGEDDDKAKVKFDGDDGSSEEWSGFDDSEKADVTKRKTSKGILKKQIYEIDNDDAPVTGTSEVVIESLDNPNTVDIANITKKMNVDLTKTEDVLNSSIVRAKKYARLMGMNDSPPEKVTKPKKKKFRYLSKTERKMNNLKQKKNSYKKNSKD